MRFKVPSSPNQAGIVHNTKRGFALVKLKWSMLACKYSLGFQHIIAKLLGQH